MVRTIVLVNFDMLVWFLLKKTPDVSKTNFLGVECVDNRNLFDLMKVKMNMRGLVSRNVSKHLFGVPKFEFAPCIMFVLMLFYILSFHVSCYESQVNL